MGDKGNVLTIGVCYKSPNADDSEVNELMDVIKKASNNMVLIMGDFNFLGINWVTLEAYVTGSKFRKYKSVLWKKYHNSGSYNDLCE